MHVEPGLRDDALGVVELRDFREVRDIAGMDHERRPDRQRLDLADRLFERAIDVRIGRLIEADMAVADLQECEGGRRLRRGFPDDAERARHAARDRPEHPGPRPGHAFEDFAPADAIVMVGCHDSSPMKARALPWTGSKEAEIY